MIEFIQTEEGLARRNGTDYSYEYNLTDHLGNVRATFYKNPNGQLAEVIQRDDYYAFGLRKMGIPNSNVNKYLYNGKELQEELGQYDYGARFYDPVIARWNAVDPLAENHHGVSSYAYVLNNPMNFIDPLGLDTVKANKIVENKPEAKQFDPKKDEIQLDDVSVTATRPIHDSQGRIIYEDGTVENFMYTGGEGSKYAVFTNRKTGVKTYFPNADIDPTMVNDGAGSTYPWSTIHMSPKNNGLEDLQHEYGHILDFRKKWKIKIYIFNNAI